MAGSTSVIHRPDGSEHSVMEPIRIADEILERPIDGTGLGRRTSATEPTLGDLFDDERTTLLVFLRHYG